MSLPDLTPHRYPLVWRWIIERVWRVEHAFERAHADGRAENDTRIRILVVAAIFSVGFLVMAGGAVWSATLSDAGKGGRAYAGAPERADLVDREGRLLAANLPHYTLSGRVARSVQRCSRRFRGSSRPRSTGPLRPSAGAWSCAD
jgi:cell division protein FtsI (penicillin-binding protein 3)